MKDQLKEELLRTLYVHFPLKADESRSLEQELLKKKIDKEFSLWDGKSTEGWEFTGLGEAKAEDDQLKIVTNTRVEYWPETEDASGRYSTFGDYTSWLLTDRQDFSEYNQIYFEVKPECPGLHSPMVRAGFENDGEQKIPDNYHREGFNAISLKNHQWNTCIWTITEIPHDCVTKIFFRIHKYGKEISTGEEMRFSFRNIKLQKVARPQVTKGWQCEEGTISVSTSGYWADGNKIAVANTKGTEFSVINIETGKCVFTGPVKKTETELGEFQILDFTDVKENGTYRIETLDAKTGDFIIGDTVLEDAIWKVINFLFCERCGFPVPDKHGTCHQDVYADHNGLRVIFSGGWHDAADVSQQATQTAEIVQSLMECSAAVKRDRMLSKRLIEEAGWGMDFILKVRFGDGYRASSAGMRRWTDNLIGNFDDVEARVHNNPFDNFLLSGIEAYGASAFQETDAELAWKCGDAAKADYWFAKEVFDEKGIVLPEYSEHTLNSCYSCHYAVMTWAASLLYQMTGEDVYEKEIETNIGKMIACQDCGESGTELKGFFYRDETKKMPVHYTHQAREHVYAQAFTEALKALPNHADSEEWRKAAESYGSYLKGLMKYGSPYGMIPSGIYEIHEPDDEETFYLVHPRLQYANEVDHYREQLKNGHWLNDRYCVKQFPVWFSFRGNNAVLLSAGKSASLLGTFLGDKELIEIARSQMYWIAGRNPFGHSFIYGEGYRYGVQYNALAGEMVGEMPVGTETQGDEDVPYWPMANIATYREVWVAVAGHWLRVAADLLKNRE